MDRDKYEDPDNIVKAEPRVSNMDDNELNAFKLWKEQKERRVKESRRKSISKSKSPFWSSNVFHSSLSNGETINHFHKIDLFFIV